jgi:hypothetical protein
MFLLVVIIVFFLICISFFKNFVKPYYITENLFSKNREACFHLLILFIAIYLSVNVAYVSDYIYESDGFCTVNLSDAFACTKMKWSSTNKIFITFGFFLFFFTMRQKVVISDESHLLFEVSKWKLLFSKKVSGEIHLKDTFYRPKNKYLIDEFKNIVLGVKFSGGGKVVIYTHIFSENEIEELKNIVKTGKHKFIFKKNGKIPRLNKFFYLFAIRYLQAKKFKKRKIIGRMLRMQEFSNWFKLIIEIKLDNKKSDRD